MRFLRPSAFQQNFVALFLVLALTIGFVGACGTGGGSSGSSGGSGSSGCTNGCALIGGSCGTSHRCDIPTVCVRTFCCYPPLSGDCSSFCGCR